LTLFAQQNEQEHSGAIFAYFGNMEATRAQIIPKVLTVGEVADYLRVHRSTIYRLLKSNQLPAFRVGSDWRFNTEAIDQWRMGATFDA
jgi:excisionase family DNA binding protein